MEFSTALLLIIHYSSLLYNEIRSSYKIFNSYYCRYRRPIAIKVKLMTFIERLGTKRFICPLIMSQNTRRVGLTSDTTGRQSMDRLGDDLCQLLLSYLKTKDCFRYECVSKQWQRLIYTTVTDLKISEAMVNEGKPMDTNRHLQAFELLLKKCSNIAFIDCDHDINDNMLSLITKHCNHLNGIYMSVENNTTNETIDKFFAKFAKRLHSLEWAKWLMNTKVEGYILNNMKCCPNLRELYLEYAGNQLSHVLSGDRNEVLFQRLHTLRVYYNNYSGDYPVDTFAQFVDTYKHNMKSIHVYIDGNTDDKPIAAVMTGLSQMRALIDLNIECPHYHYTDVVNDHLRQIGINCSQIRRLALKIRLDSDPYDELIAVLNDHFKRVKRLKIDGSFVDRLRNPPANPCKRITHLKLSPLYYDWINDNESDHFIDNTDTVFPSIVSLNVSCLIITD
ncbi:unnamed protein product, partial [Oppiella nova]